MGLGFRGLGVWVVYGSGGFGFGGFGEGLGFAGFLGCD